MATRKYEQRLRAQAAEETRRGVLDALHERLRAAPHERVSVERVAHEAGVARSTVYLLFGSRAGLFDAFGADLLHSGGFEDMLRAVGQHDAREALLGGIRRGAEMYAAHRDGLRALFSMAQLDADAVGGSIQRLEEGRAAGMDGLAQRLAEQGRLRPGTSAEDASRVLWVQSSFDSFDLLYTGRGLPVAEVAATLAGTAERALCG